MNWHQILFTMAMVRAILAGDKTQTRRVLTRRNGLPDGYQWPEWAWNDLDFDAAWVDPGLGGGQYLKVPRPLLHGVSWDGDTVHRVWSRISVGDRLWVRETWRPDDYDQGGFIYRADCPDEDADVVRWRPSIHMPRRASRLTLAVTDVRIQRVQDISERDAQAEGTTPAMQVPGLSVVDLAGRQYREGFRMLWDSINAGRGYGWDSNPWCWAVSFEVA